MTRFSRKSAAITAFAAVAAGAAGMAAFHYAPIMRHDPHALMDMTEEAGQPARLYPNRAACDDAMTAVKLNTMFVMQARALHPGELNPIRLAAYADNIRAANMPIDREIVEAVESAFQCVPQARPR